MKKITLLTTLLLGAASAQAQVSVMPKAGVTLSRIHYDNDPAGQEYQLGVVGGLAVPIALGESRFSVQPELLFVQKGERYETGGRESKTTLNYLEVPVLAKYTFGSDVFQAFLNAGPSLGVGLTGKAKTEGAGGDREVDVRFGDAKGDGRIYRDNRLDFGVQFGGGVGLGLGTGQLQAEARYGLGLTDVDDNKSTNRTWAFTLGYLIPLGTK
jgi:hypothetical protein